MSKDGVPSEKPSGKKEGTARNHEYSQECATRELIAMSQWTRRVSGGIGKSRGAGTQARHQLPELPTEIVNLQLHSLERETTIDNSRSTTPAHMPVRLEHIDWRSEILFCTNVRILPLTRSRFSTTDRFYFS